MKKILFPILALVLALGLALPMATPVLADEPVPVTLWFSGTIEYYDGAAWQTFTKPTMSLTPGSYTFRFSGDTRPLAQAVINVSAPSIQKNIAYLQLKDHTGAGLAGGTARGGYGSSYSAWFVSGATDANGVLLDVRSVGSQPATMSYEMRFNNTTQVKTQDVSVNSFFDFQTILLTLRLETCGSIPLDGGNARYGIGGTYTTWWFPGGVTGSSASGETAAEFFPGTYSFEMNYKHTAARKLSVAIPNADTKLTWQTTTVTLYYSGVISYGGGGDASYFTKPSMELLEGTYWFHFRGVGRTQLTFSGCSFDNAVRFFQNGVGNDFLGTVLTIDGTVNIGVSDLPKMFGWDPLSSHTFAYGSPLVVGGKQYVWTSTTGLSSDQSGTITVPYAGGSVTGNYMTQYYLTVQDNIGNKIPDCAQSGWYNECTYITLTAPSPYIDPATGAVYLFAYWDVDGTSQGMGVDTIIVHMDAPHTATAYYLVSINKELTSGNPEVTVGTKVDFTMMITVHAYTEVTGVTVTDGIGADLVVCSLSASSGTATWAKASTKGKMSASIVTWSIGSPTICTDYMLDIAVHTGLNPQGKQEYTSPGDKYLNSGPVVYFTYDGTLYQLQGPKVTVTAVP